MTAPTREPRPDGALGNFAPSTTGPVAATERGMITS